MLQARALGYAVDGHALLSDIDLGVRPGSITVLIGPNGAGKSTLLRILSGELKPTSGHVLLDGQPLASISAAGLSQRRAVVPQASVLAFPFTALEVVMLGVTVPGFETDTSQARKVATHTLEAVGMLELADRLYLHLSGGERQRVHLARALSQLARGSAAARETCYFLLDEPTSSLDLAHQSMVLATLHTQAQRGTAVVAVFHDLNLAAAVADELVLLKGGRIMVCGTPIEVLKDDLLSKAYGCQVSTNRTPAGERPFVLPPAALAPNRPRTA